MVQLENLTADAVEICIINLCADSDNSNIPNETHWRVGLLNSAYGREQLLEVLADYPASIRDVLATWGDSPTIIED